MLKCKLSDQPKFWAVRRGYGWMIFDRDRADKHIASLDHAKRCSWHDRDYWGTSVSEWKAVCHG